MRNYKFGDHLQVKLSGGRIVEAGVKAVVENRQPSSFRIHSGTKRR
jgi:hypothetical protein